MDARTFFRYAERITAYSGVVAARVVAQQARSTPAPRGGGSRSEAQPLSAVMLSDPDLIERVTG